MVEQTETTNPSDRRYQPVDRSSTQPPADARQVHGHTPARSAHHTSGWIPRRTPGSTQSTRFPTDNRPKVTSRCVSLAVSRGHTSSKSHQSAVRSQGPLLLARHVSTSGKVMHSLPNLPDGFSATQTPQNEVRRACTTVNGNATTRLRHRLLWSIQGGNHGNHRLIHKRNHSQSSQQQDARWRRPDNSQTYHFSTRCPSITKDRQRSGIIITHGRSIVHL